MNSFSEWLKEAREDAYFFESFDSHYVITETKKVQEFTFYMIYR